jgi:hypothetical protein
MALVLADRVRETTTTTGTGTISLGGPVSGFEGFGTAIGNANTTYYAIVDAATGAWEVGLGTYTSSGSTLARTTILSSSNAGSAVNFAAGTKDVFVTQPAERALYLNGAGTGVDAGAAAFTANGVVYASSTSALATGSALTFDGTSLKSTGKIRANNAGVPTADVGFVTLNGYQGTSSANGGFAIAPTAGGGAEFYTHTGAVGSESYTEQARLTTSGLEIKQSQLIGYSSYAGIGTNGLAVAGNVGVGTDTPVSRLDVYDSSSVSTADLFIVRDYLGGGVSDKTRMIIKNGGNVGVGTASPGHKLQVNGNIRVEGATSEIFMAVGAERTISASGSASSTALTFKRWNGASYVDDVVMDGAGNLGLGVTPSAWNLGKVIEGPSSEFFVAALTPHIVSNAIYNSGYIYKTTAAASYYVQTVGAHQWFIAPSGTAGDPISFTQAMDLANSSGASTLTVNSAINTASAVRLTTSGGLNAGMFLASPLSDHSLGFQTVGTERGRFSSDGTFRVKGAGTAGSTDAFQVAGTAPADAARITSGGELLIGTASVVDFGFLSLKYNGTLSNGIVFSDTSNSGTTNACSFKRNSTTTVGAIQLTTTTTAYVTSSDYRLKHDIQPMTGALAKVQQLKPVTYKWNADDNQSQGFIAHELQEVVPECVTGKKDGVDAEGKPVYQGIDTSFLVATLTAAIQEQQTLITALTARITALESSTLQ